MVFRAIFATLCTFGTLIGFTQGATGSTGHYQDSALDPEKGVVSASEDHPRVLWEILFDVEALVPGQQAHLVVALKVPKDWHIYWETPGESGMATYLEVTGPAGWRIGQPIFPGPSLYSDAQGNLCHVLEGEIGFFVPILTPEDAVPGNQVEFQVEMHWLQCQTICLLGGIKTAIEYPVASGHPKRANQSRLTALRKLLPKKGLGPLATGVAFGGEAEDAYLQFFAKDARLFEFFTFSDSPMVLSKREAGEVAATGSQRNFRLRPKEDGGPEDLETIEVHGVLRVTTKDQVTFFEIALRGQQRKEPVDQPMGHGNLPTVPRDKK